MCHDHIWDGHPNFSTKHRLGLIDIGKYFKIIRVLVIITRIHMQFIENTKKATVRHSNTEKNAKNLLK